MIRALPLVLLLVACSAVSPRIDEGTGTTLAQRCVDYRASLAAMDAAGESDTDAYAFLKAFVTVNCPPVPGLKPEAP